MKNKYEYRVAWSEGDQVYIGRVAEFSSLAVHGDTPERALAEIQSLVSCVVEDMQEQGEPVPEPLSVRSYSGQVDIHMPEYLHRELMSEASWQHVSLSQLIVSKLATSLMQSSQKGR
jgi:predicted RNase H-like HicB family nuclease